jgi:uncharacterized protein YjiS (DUF1127 family)
MQLSAKSGLSPFLDTLSSCDFHIDYRAAPLTCAVQRYTWERSGKWERLVGLDRRGRNQEGGQPEETAMKKFSLTRFLRARRVYWSVLQELSAYTDRELHDIGIDRADIHEIARLASREQN